jgi:hypothetical protein
MNISIKLSMTSADQPVQYSMSTARASSTIGTGAGGAEEDVAPMVVEDPMNVSKEIMLNNRCSTMFYYFLFLKKGYGQVDS